VQVPEPALHAVTERAARRHKPVRRVNNHPNKRAREARTSLNHGACPHGDRGAGRRLTRCAAPAARVRTRGPQHESRGTSGFVRARARLRPAPAGRAIEAARGGVPYRGRPAGQGGSGQACCGACPRATLPCRCSACVAMPRIAAARAARRGPTTRRARRAGRQAERQGARPW
jgi:hypothetical protein